MEENQGVTSPVLAQAAPIPVLLVNGDFDDPNQGFEIGACCNLGNFTRNVIGWQTIGDGGAWNANENIVFRDVPDSDAPVGYLNSNASIYQVSNLTIAAGAEYLFAFRFLNREDGFGNGNAIVTFFADAIDTPIQSFTVDAAPLGSFRDDRFLLTAAMAAPFVGQRLGIQISHGGIGIQVNFDEAGTVLLLAPPQVPLPPAISVLLTGLAAIGARQRLSRRG